MPLPLMLKELIPQYQGQGIPDAIQSNAEKHCMISGTSTNLDSTVMWRVIIECSAESWRNHATAFKAIAEKYPATPLSSKKMKDDERRVMEYQLQDVNDVEAFMEECSTLSGFMTGFEAL